MCPITATHIQQLYFTKINNTLGSELTKTENCHAIYEQSSIFLFSISATLPPTRQEKNETNYKSQCTSFIVLIFHYRCINTGSRPHIRIQQKHFSTKLQKWFLPLNLSQLSPESYDRQVRKCKRRFHTSKIKQSVNIKRKRRASYIYLFTASYLNNNTFSFS